MKTALAVIPLTICCLASGQNQPAQEPAEKAITDAFKNHSIVMLGELHGNKQEYEVLRSLVESRVFTDEVDDLVLEYGNALYQDVVDRYIGGEDVPLDEVSNAWRNTTAIGAPSPIYGWLYAAVREANRKRTRKLRIVLGDVYVNWNRVKDREDLGPYVANRDPFYARVVKEQVITEPCWSRVIHTSFGLMPSQTLLKESFGLREQIHLLF
jgi:hypothetical protein